MHNSKLDDHSIIANFPYAAYIQAPDAFKPSLSHTLLKILVDGQFQDDGIPCAKKGISFDICANLLQINPALHDALLQDWKEGSFNNFRKLEPFQSLVSGSETADGRPTLIPSKSATTYLQNASIIGAKITTVGGDQHNYTTSQVDRQREIANWISKLDFLPIQQETIKKRTPLTGRGMLNSSEFKEWYDASDSAVLWCYGLPGSGKTVQASIIIDYLERESIVCYVYFNYKTQKDIKYQDTIFSLLKQLFILRPEMFHDLENIYKLHGEGRSPLQLEDAKGLLTNGLSSYTGRFNIVLDALDEYQTEFHLDDMKKLIQGMLSLRQNTKLLATSRMIGKFEQVFQNQLFYSLEIAASRSDIELHIKHTIDQNESFRNRLIGKLHQAVIEKLLAVSGTRFLLAQLHLESLSRLPLPRDIDGALANLSIDIDPAYEQVVKRIQEQEPWRRDLAIQIISWITCAYRKLTLKELQHALAVKPHMHKISEYDIHLESTINSVCAGLVVIEQESETVRFIHKTTQEYFSQNLKHGSLLSHAHHLITRTCLAYLLLDFPVKAIAGMRPWEAQRNCKEYMLFRYAAEYWPQHLNQLRQDADSENLLISIINREKGVLLRMKFGNYSGNILHFLCIEGYTNALKTLLKHSAGVIEADSRDDDGRTPLSHAAEHGHISIVQLLLERGDVKVDSESKSGRTPLSFAAEKSQESVIRLLLKQGAAANSRDNKGRTPLSYVVAPEKTWLSWIWDILCSLINSEPTTSLTVISLFLEQDDIDVNAKDTNGRTPLSYAAEMGNIVFVKVILDNGKTIPDLPDNTGRTPRSYAEARRYREIAALLKERETKRIMGPPASDKATPESEPASETKTESNKGKEWKKIVYVVIVVIFLLSISILAWVRRRKASQEAAKKHEEETSKVVEDGEKELAIATVKDSTIGNMNLKTLSFFTFVFVIILYFMTLDWSVPMAFRFWED